MKLLDGKVALVTGGGSGIGRSIALLYAENGAKVIVSDINVSGGEQTVDTIVKAGGKAHFVKADVGNPADNERQVQAALDRYGSLHIACNNAGIGGNQLPVGELSVEDWDKVVRINLSGVFYGMHFQIPAMLKSGGGAIVNISSILGKVGFPGASAYVAAKHGLVGLTQNAALEYAAQGIRVNVVGPAFINTPLIAENLSAEQVEQIRQLHPIGRLGEPEEVAELVLWLSSDKASFVTGAYYPVDGAYLAR